MADEFPTADLIPGRSLGHFRILERLGRGGMGEVWAAEDTRLRRRVALKLLNPEGGDSAERVARFRREAEALATLNHPNIVTIYAIEEAAGVNFLVMELVEGTTLKERITSNGLPGAMILELARPLADAIAAAHRCGIVHRDLKPTNIMVTADGRPKILDFGIARLRAPSEAGRTTDSMDITKSGSVFGTPAYMAPEQFLGEQVDHRCDLFAFGVILFEMATGRPPFVASSYPGLLSAVLYDTPSIDRARPVLGPGLTAIVARCLAKDPEHRPARAEEVVHELAALAGRVSSPAAVAPARSVAVLPFTTTGHAEEDEDFALGITEDVIASLCKVRELRVISSASVRPFRNRDVALEQIASRLNVVNLLDGSVRKSGDRVRIVVQLVDARNGHSLWADTYDRRLTDIFEIQTDVALQIARALESELTPRERERIIHGAPPDLEAYEHYLRGRRRYVTYSTDGILEAIEHFERALARDPEFALAHVGRATALMELLEFGALEDPGAATRAMSSAAKAVALDPDLGEAHCVLGFGRMLFEYDWAGAEASYRRAIELSPGSGEVYSRYGRLLSGIGRFDEAIAVQQRARELDPLSSLSDFVTTLVRAGRHDEAIRAARHSLVDYPDYTRLHATLGWALFLTGMREDGIEELKRAVQLSPTEPTWLAQLGQAYGLAGQRDAALAIEQQLRAWPTWISPYQQAYLQVGLGEHERALDLLEQALDMGTGGSVGLKGSFLFAPLRGHPRFVALLRRMGLE